MNQRFLVSRFAARNFALGHMPLSSHNICAKMLGSSLGVDAPYLHNHIAVCPPSRSVVFSWVQGRASGSYARHCIWLSWWAIFFLIVMVLWNILDAVVIIYLSADGGSEFILNFEIDYVEVLKPNIRNNIDREFEQIRLFWSFEYLLEYYIQLMFTRFRWHLYRPLYLRSPTLLVPLTSSCWEWPSLDRRSWWDWDYHESFWHLNLCWQKNFWILILFSDRRNPLEDNNPLKPNRFGNLKSLSVILYFTN